LNIWPKRCQENPIDIDRINCETVAKCPASRIIVWTQSKLILIIEDHINYDMAEQSSNCGLDRSENTKSLIQNILKNLMASKKGNKIKVRIEA